MKFNEIIGQKAAESRLKQLVLEGRLPHAILLYGANGVGKMPLALAFASYLLGEREIEENNEIAAHGIQLHASDNAVAMLKKWEHPDLHFTFPTVKLPGMSSEHKPVSDDFLKEWRQMLDTGSYFTLEQWMTAMGATTQQAIITAGESDALSHKLSFMSSQGGYKISIIWLPERMNIECANKLLKLLEEPPAQTLFLMVSEEPERLLETIISRTQRIEIKAIDATDIEEALVARRGIERETARRIARLADGSWLKALEELDSSNEKHSFLELFIALMRLSYQRQINELKKWSEQVATMGREKQKRMLAYFMRMVRENFMYNFRNTELNYMTREEENFASKFSRFINEANVIEITELLQRCIRDIGQNANGKIVFFDMALKIIVLLNKK